MIGAPSPERAPRWGVRGGRYLCGVIIGGAARAAMLGEQEMSSGIRTDADALRLTCVHSAELTPLATPAAVSYACAATAMPR